MTDPTDATRSQEATEAKPLPSWLPGGCPPWCDAGDEHSERDHYDDRVHFGPNREVVLTAVDDRNAGGDDAPAVARVYLRQHYREIGPRLDLARDDAPVDIEFTVEEAEEFAGKLLELVTLARNAADTTDAEKPVAERSSGPLSGWVWPGSGRVDVFRDERRPDHDRALTPAEAEEFARGLDELAAIAREQ